MNSCLVPNETLKVAGLGIEIQRDDGLASPLRRRTRHQSLFLQINKEKEKGNAGKGSQVEKKSYDHNQPTPFSERRCSLPS